MTDELTKVAEDSARGSFFLISGTALAAVIMAIASILIARFLGDELYGQYTLAFVMPNILFLFTDLGINQGIIKFTASLKAKGETSRLTRIVKYGILVKAVTGIVIFIVDFALADFFASVLLQRPAMSFYVRIASISILFQAVFATSTSAFIGLDKTEYNAVATDVQAISKTIISITLVLLGFSVIGAIVGLVASYLAGAVAGMLLLFLMLRYKQKVEDNHRVIDDLKTLMRYGAPLYVSLLLAGFIPLFQNLMLAIFTSDADIGNYKAAANFATLISVVSLPITTALLPAFSKLESSTTQKIRTFFKLANKYTCIVIIPITVMIITFSNEIVYIIYPGFQSAPTFLGAYSMLYFLTGLGYLTLASFYNGLGETRTTMKMSLITFLTLVPLSPILTQTYGVLGSIIALLTASATGTIYGSYKARRNFKIDFGAKAIAKIYLVSMASGILPLLVLKALPVRIFLRVVAGGLLYLLTYITLVPAARIVDSTELKTAATVLRRIKPLSPLIQPVIKYQQKILGLQEPKSKKL